MPGLFRVSEHLRNRPLSWSQLSSFEYDPRQWYDTYIRGIRQESKELTFGSYVDKRIQDDPSFLPALPRYEHMQYKMRAEFAGIPLVGIPDGLNLTREKVLADFKTGKKPWDRKRTDETGQLTFYLLLLYFTERRMPEEFECRIHWLPTEEKGDFTIGFVREGDIRTFVTRRTMLDLLRMCERIKRVTREMEEYVNGLSTVAESTASATITRQS